ncbi:MAG: glycosyltransferase [Candidatus Micrarchaeota archaeon]
MKVALFTDTYVPQMNGVVAYLNDAIRLLSQSEEVVLFAPGEGRYRCERVSEKFRICWIPSSPFPFYEGYRVASMDYRRVSKLLREEKPDIVHAHAPINLGLQGILAAKREKIPVVVTYHTHFPDYVPHLLNGRLPKVLAEASSSTVKKMIKHIFGMADIVTAPTEELARELRSYGLRNVVLLKNGIDFSKQACTQDEAASFRKAWGIPPEGKVALYLGRISFEKKLDRVLEAFKMVEKDGRYLVIVGGGPYLKRFKELASSLGVRNAVFTGFSKKTAPAYHSADFFISASDTETFGMTFVEGMYHGLPCIGVNRLGAKELIKDKRNGLLVEPDDVAGLAKAMERLFEDDALCGKLGKAARESALGYSITDSVEETRRLYRSLVKGRA